jgi:hypothetical protein
MTTASFSIQIDQNDMRKVEEMLSDIQKAPAKVTTRALNKTLTGVRTDASSAIREVITASKSAVDGTFRIQKASENRVEAWISSTGKRLPLSAYSVRQTKKGVSVHVKRVNPRKVIPGTFIATMKSGHTGVFERGARKPMMATWHGQTGQQPKRPNMNYGRLPKKYRLPIQELFGLRVPDVMVYEPTMTTILKQANERLHKNLMHEMDFELSKHK